MFFPTSMPTWHPPAPAPRLSVPRFATRPVSLVAFKARDPLSPAKPLVPPRLRSPLLRPSSRVPETVSLTSRPTESPLLRPPLRLVTPLLRLVPPPASRLEPTDRPALATRRLESMDRPALATRRLALATHRLALATHRLALATHRPALATHRLEPTDKPALATHKLDPTDKQAL